MDSDMLILASVLISEFGRKSDKENEIELWVCHFLHLAEYKGKRTQICAKMPFLALKRFSSHG